jgi:hypothetical protein
MKKKLARNFEKCCRTMLAHKKHAWTNVKTFRPLCLQQRKSAMKTDFELRATGISHLQCKKAIWTYILHWSWDFTRKLWTTLHLHLASSTMMTFWRETWLYYRENSLRNRDDLDQNLKIFRTWREFDHYSFWENLLRRQWKLFASEKAREQV